MDSHFTTSCLVEIRTSVIAQETRVQGAFEGYVEHVFAEPREDVGRVDDEIVVFGDKLMVADLELIVTCSIIGAVGWQFIKLDVFTVNRQVLRVQRDVVGKCMNV